MLKLTNLHKTFNAGTVNEKKALNGLNFQLDRGDSVSYTHLMPMEEIS